MPGLTLPPGFGDTEWAEDRWARAQAMTGIKHLVENVSAWRPTRVATSDRTINLAAGSATVGHGAVYDLTTGAGDNVQVEANLTATVRYDLVIARWNWSTKARTFEVLKGSAVPPLLNTTGAFAAAQVNRLIGNVYDGAIALVRVRPNIGVLAADDITDVRMFMDGSIPRMLSNYLSYCDFGINQLVHTPGGLTKYTGGAVGQVQDISQGRVWLWGGNSGYLWQLNNGQWNAAPGAAGKFQAVAGHTYMVVSSFGVGAVPSTANLNWRFSQQYSTTGPMNNSRYGSILIETSGSTGGQTFPSVSVSSFFSGGDYNGDVWTQGFFASSGPIAVQLNFSSPVTWIVDLGAGPAMVYGTGL